MLHNQEEVKLSARFPSQIGDAPLYWAARHGQMDVVQYLCARGAAVNAQDSVSEHGSHLFSASLFFSFARRTVHLSLVIIARTQGRFTCIQRWSDRFHTSLSISLPSFSTTFSIPLFLHASSLFSLFSLSLSLSLSSYGVESHANWSSSNTHAQFLVNLSMEILHTHLTLHFCCVFIIQAGETSLHVTARYGHPDVLAHLVAVGGCVDLQDKVGCHGDKWPG